MSVCLYVCMYVCMYACMYVMHVWMYVCIYVWRHACDVYVCMYVFMYVCMCVCTAMYVIYVCMHACVHACMYVCMYVAEVSNAPMITEGFLYVRGCFKSWNVRTGQKGGLAASKGQPQMAPYDRVLAPELVPEMAPKNNGTPKKEKKGPS